MPGVWKQHRASDKHHLLSVSQWQSRHRKLFVFHLHRHKDHWLHKTLSPEWFWWQDTEARLLQHLPDLVASSRHRVSLHLPGALMVRGELHVPGKVSDREAVAFFLLDLGNVRATVLLLVHDPTEELFKDWAQKEKRIWIMKTDISWKLKHLVFAYRIYWFWLWERGACCFARCPQLWRRRCSQSSGRWSPWSDTMTRCYLKTHIRIILKSASLHLFSAALHQLHTVIKKGNKFQDAAVFIFL